MSTSKNPKPKLAGRRGVFENRRIRDVSEDRRERLDAPDDEDRGEEGCPNSEPQVQTRLDRTACSAGWFNQE